MTSRTPVTTVTWRAHDRDGVGHALPKTHGYSRYLCNRMPVSERFAWPVKLRCAVCVARLEEVATG